MFGGKRIFIFGGCDIMSLPHNIRIKKLVMQQRSLRMYDHQVNPGGGSLRMKTHILGDSSQYNRLPP